MRRMMLLFALALCLALCLAGCTAQTRIERMQMPDLPAEGVSAEMNLPEREEEAYPDAQSISSPTKTIRETVELGQEDTEPEPLSCPACGGEMVTQQKIELGEWCTLYTEACPQERMGCLHAIQERSVLCYDRCEDCGEVVGRHFLQQRDAGCFTGNDLR